MAGTVPAVHGTAVWSTPEWRDGAVAWLDEQLRAAGIERTGDVEQPHLRPWATALRAPTTAGPVWLKAPGPGTVFEVGLYGLLTRTDLADALVAALAGYGRLQQDLAPHVEEILALGVADMRAPVMRERFEQALDAAAAAVGGGGSSEDRATLGQVAAMGDSVVAHPFAALLVPLGFVQRLLGAGLDDPRFLRARDAYLAVFEPVAPHEDLVATLELACRVAKIARVLTWERALRAAREQDEDIDADWARAPLETLASLLLDSYLGGA
ncbi:MAG: aminoglycoside phosphotransferase family protein [Acidimicrobiia bacterium]